MNLTALLAARADAGRPVRVGLIGAGKFGSMFLAQTPTIPGLEVAVIADLDPERAKNACRAVGCDDTRIAGTRFPIRAAPPARPRMSRSSSTPLARRPPASRTRFPRLRPASRSSS
jgi:hypothetical protein